MTHLKEEAVLFGATVRRMTGGKSLLDFNPTLTGEDLKKARKGIIEYCDGRDNSFLIGIYPDTVGPIIPMPCTLFMERREGYIQQRGRKCMEIAERIGMILISAEEGQGGESFIVTRRDEEVIIIEDMEGSEVVTLCLFPFCERIEGYEPLVAQMKKVQALTATTTNH